MSKFIVVATIFMLVFPCATSAQEVSSLPKETEDRTYRPEVEFFVDLSEAEVAEAAVGQLLRSPSGKPALDELRNVEKMMLWASPDLVDTPKFKRPSVEFSQTHEGSGNPASSGDADDCRRSRCSRTAPCGPGDECQSLDHRPPILS